MTRSDAFDYLDKLREFGVSDTQILEYILGNHLPGHRAAEIMSDAIGEFLGDLEEDEDEDDGFSDDYAHWTFV